MKKENTQEEAEKKGQNDYDGVFKRKLQKGSITFLKKYLNENFEVLNTENSSFSQVAREADFVFKIKQKGKESILHVEVQTQEDKTMHARMLTYAALLYERYGCEIKQIVLYLGKEKNLKNQKMLCQNDLGYFTYRYKLVNISEINYSYFLKNPDTFIFALLGKYETKNLEKVMQEIGKSAKRYYTTEQEFSDLAEDLEIIAQLRNLQLEVKNLIDKIMPITIDVTKSSGYQKGKKEGKLETAKALIISGYLSSEQIAEVTGLTPEQIKDLEQKVKKKKK